MPTKKYQFMQPDYEEQRKLKAREYYALHKHKRKSQAKKWEKKNYKYRLSYKRENWRKNLEHQKEQTFLSMGNKCCACGFSDKRALQIDHINGNGKIDKNRISNRIQFLRYVQVSYLSGDLKYQLLCANCNWIKRHENKENTPRKDPVSFIPESQFPS